jgi:metal-sulfur cluster biosynthetic enzyme
MVALTEESVRAALNTIVDPCSVIAGVPAGLADMGLVRQITVTDGRVEAVIGVTEPTCLMGVTFLRDARAVLANLDGVSTYDVRFDYQLKWNESMMTTDYRVALTNKRSRQ